jgi:hypothetical protein
MHFFRAREAADDWVRTRDAVVSLSLEDAFELAKVHWLDRSKRALLRHHSPQPA